MPGLAEAPALRLTARMRAGSEKSDRRWSRSSRWRNVGVRPEAYHQPLPSAAIFSPAAEFHAKRSVISSESDQRFQGKPISVFTGKRSLPAGVKSLIAMASPRSSTVSLSCRKTGLSLKFRSPSASLPVELLTPSRECPIRFKFAKCLLISAQPPAPAVVGRADTLPSHCLHFFP